MANDDANGLRNRLLRHPLGLHDQTAIPRCPAGSRRRAAAPGARSLLGLACGINLDDPRYGIVRLVGSSRAWLRTLRNRRVPRRILLGTRRWRDAISHRRLRDTRRKFILAAASG